MLAGRSPFDIVGASENPDQNTEDYLFHGSFRLTCCEISHFNIINVFLQLSLRKQSAYRDRCP